jgi:hypothetical protein
MLVITNKQEFQLLLPLIGGLGFVVMCVLLFRGTGDLNRYTFKALIASGGLLAYALYLTVWQNELKYVWSMWPLVLIFGLFMSLIVPIGLFYWIWRVQVSAKVSGALIAPPNAPALSPFTKLFRAAVLIWGMINLIGLLVAIIRLIENKR